MAKKISLFLTLMLFFVGAAVYAQVTTASMNGLITEKNGKDPIVGANIQATHEASGTKYYAATNAEGKFTIQGMRTGKYSVEVSFIGYQTAKVTDVELQLGGTYPINVYLNEASEMLEEAVISGKASRFSGVKTGAGTNISPEQMREIPSINRTISDIARLSPYAGSSMSFAGGDGRSTNFTIDGANFNNNFGLSSDLPGGGSPISMDAIEEVQVVIAPYDVRQTNFIGGGINAITKSGTNTFKGSAYVYYRDQELRGNRIDGKDLGAREDEKKTTYGFTLGGPIIKNKLFFFGNYEKEETRGQVIKYRARGDDEKAGDMVSRTKLSDMEKVAQHLKDKYGYDPGSATSFPADKTNEKFLVRLDWNIVRGQRLSVRYNNTKNTAWNAPNGNSMDGGSNARLNNTSRVGAQSMAFSGSMYSMENKVESWSVDLNSRFNDKISNQLLFTYTNIQDKRGSNSSIFPHVDIMYGLDDNGKQILEPYMTAGYELFTYNSAVENKITSIIDNFTYFLGGHKLTAGISYEHQFANNAYMRNGTGYYRYRSLDEFLNDAAPETVSLTYGFNGNKNPNAQVTFNQLGFYVQDEWDILSNLKLTYGVRFDDLMFDNDDLARNDAIYALDFGGKKIDTGKWPKSRVQVSPRLGFSWDVFKDNSLKVRGGTGLFAGRLPLVYFTNMPTNANMVQNSVIMGTSYDKSGNVSSRDNRLDVFKGGMITNVDEMVSKLGLPTTIEKHVAGSKISGVEKNFKMPHIWKSSLALDYNVPVSFPLTLTGEFMLMKTVQAVNVENINIKDPSLWNGGKGAQRYNGADKRMIYASDMNYYKGKNAVMLTNTTRGHGYTVNFTVNAKPVEGLDVMLAYTHTESKEVSGLPGSDPVSTWQGLYTVDGPNFATTQRSQYVTPDKVIGSLSYYIPFRHNGLISGMHLNLFYNGYSAGGYSFLYDGDINGDGIKGVDLMYIPRNDSEIAFKSDADRKAFWAFVQQDHYLKHHKGEYAEAYAARAPWVHRFDFRWLNDFKFNIGKTTHNFQLSVDIMNVGNLIRSSWGIPKTNVSVSNNLKILKYEGTKSDSDLTPVFSMAKVNGEYITKTYDYNKSYDNCWKMQVGLRYIFN